MVETFTTDFVSVEDGDVTPFTPQELVQQNALIDVVNAEAQWRGVSSTEFNIERDSRTNTDSGSAVIREFNVENENIETGRTVGETVTESDTKRETIRRESEELEADELNDFDLSAPFPEDPSSKYPNADVELERVEAEFFSELINDTSISIDGISYDSEPYLPTVTERSDIGAVDTETYISYNTGDPSVKKIGGYVQYIGDEFWYDFWYDNATIARGPRSVLDIGLSDRDPDPIIKFIVEATLVYTVTTREQEVEREKISLVYPSVPSGATFDRHVILKYINGNFEDSEYIYSNKAGEVYTELTTEKVNSKKEIRIITEGTKRETVSQEASVSYPDIEDTFSFDRHEIEVVEDGDTVISDTVYENRIGETISRTSDKPTESVSITATTFYSKTTSNTLNTTSPSIQSEYLPERINTDSVSLLFDTSGSADQTEQEEIGRRIVRQLGDSSQVSVVDFDYDAVELVGLDSLESNRNDVIDAINQLDADGGTDIGVGLNAAADSLNGNDGTIVLITDGEAGDDPISIAEEIGGTGIQIVTIQVGDGNRELLEQIASVSDGVFFDGSIDTELFGTVLNDNELSQWKELNGVTREEQVFTHSIEGSGLAEFRFRFDWEYLTPEPTFGTTGLYDESAGVWREVAVANEEDSALQYTHVQVFNDEQDEWGALDVVDLSNENAIEAFQFYDEDAGWLAPRQFNTV